MAAEHPRVPKRPLDPTTAAVRELTDLPDPADEVVDLVERYVASLSSPRNPAAIRAVAATILGLVRDRASLIGGDWLNLLQTHVYIHYWGKGYGTLASLALADKLVQFMHRTDVIEGWDRARLLYEVDTLRAFAGGRPRNHPVAWERLVPVRDLPATTAAFLGTDHGLSPFDSQLVPSALRVYASVLTDGDVVRFGALDAEKLELMQLRDPAYGANPGSDLTLMRIGARFYRWLGESQRLEPSRAAAIAERLTRHALLLTTEPVAC